MSGEIKRIQIEKYKFRFDKTCMTNSIKRVCVIGNSQVTRIAAIQKVLENNLQGDQAEFGVYTGGTAK